ncbi:MAG: ribonuclease HII [Candidatus Thorarchaeota archaeon]|jgi:ribonuclease HII
MTGLFGTAGIDEAGRGPMVGPMVICGVLIDSEKLPELVQIGARDSKTLSHSRRLKLKDKIEQVTSKIVIRSVSAAEIDRLRKRTTLNEIEVTEFASIAKSLKPQELYLDAADVKADRFGEKIGNLSGLASKGAVIISEHKADSKYPIVSAASIIAKVERDRVISEYHEKYGDFGSGYPSDPKTVDFVKNLVRNKQDLPPIIRKSWDSVRKILDDASTEQSTLG